MPIARIPDLLIVPLSMEAARFHELPVRPAFSLLAVLRDDGAADISAS